MRTRPQDERSTEELLAVALEDVDSEAASRIVAILHSRGTRTELEAASRLAKGDDPQKRILAARILGQLGLQRRPFHRQSVGILIDLLGDDVPEVVAAASVALAHRHDPRAIPHLIRLHEHSDARIRYGVAVALGGYDRLDAIKALLKLAADSDTDVRSWATIGLASMTDYDSDDVRYALLIRVSDEDPEVRGEALIGLARRRDPRVLELVRDELRKRFEGDWSVEAAEILRDPTLHGDLKSLWSRLDDDDQSRFKGAFDRAFVACRPKKE